MYLGSEIVIPALICIAIILCFFIALKKFKENNSKPKEERKVRYTVLFVFSCVISFFALIILLLAVFLMMAVAHM